MTQDYKHPITPPPELVQQWASEWIQLEYVNRDNFMAARAAQWGADQELEACCEWLHKKLKLTVLTLDVGLRAARRPKPPSLKQRALEAMHRNWNPHNNDDFATISRALEQLDD